MTEIGLLVVEEGEAIIPTMTIVTIDRGGAIGIETIGTGTIEIVTITRAAGVETETEDVGIGEVSTRIAMITVRRPKW